MGITETKEKLLEKINQELNYIKTNSTTGVDKDLSIVILNLTEAYKNLSDIKEEK